MVYRTLEYLSELSWSLGLIGLDELQEQVAVASWLSDEERITQDPRCDENDELTAKEVNDASENQGIVEVLDSESYRENNPVLQIVILKTWYFTGADPDSYPSVPHGHYQNVNRKWPKLNPYTGRVFLGKHREDLRQRLTKNQMRRLWSDEQFKDFCRIQILRRAEMNNFAFPVKHILRFPRW
jgi:hypothetical protein